MRPEQLLAEKLKISNRIELLSWLKVAIDLEMKHKISIDHNNVES